MQGRVLLACIAALLFPNSFAAQETTPSYRFKVGTGYHFSTGKYGASESTEVSYVPLTLRGDLDAWSATLTVPYLRIDGPAVVIDGIETVAGSSDGLGDITLRGSYLISPLYEWMPFLDLVGRIKFPTASRADGLGTGEFDYGFEVDASERFGSLTPFLTAGYRILGSPPGSTLRNVGLASIGAAYQLSPALPVGLLLDYRDAASSASRTRLEIVSFLTWKLHPHWSVDLYLSAGLAAGSPDVGTGIQLSWCL